MAQAQCNLTAHPMHVVPMCQRGAVLLLSAWICAPCWALALGRKDAGRVGGSQGRTMTICISKLGTGLRCAGGQGLSRRSQRRELGPGASSMQSLSLLGRALRPSPYTLHSSFSTSFSPPCGIHTFLQDPCSASRTQSCPFTHTLCLCCSLRPSDSHPWLITWGWDGAREGRYSRRKAEDLNCIFQWNH